MPPLAIKMRPLGSICIWSCLLNNIWVEMYILYVKIQLHFRGSAQAWWYDTSLILNKPDLKEPNTELFFWPIKPLRVKWAINCPQNSFAEQRLSEVKLKVRSEASQQNNFNFLFCAEALLRAFSFATLSHFLVNLILQLIGQFTSKRYGPGNLEF